MEGWGRGSDFSRRPLSTLPPSDSRRYAGPGGAFAPSHRNVRHTASGKRLLVQYTMKEATSRHRENSLGGTSLWAPTPHAQSPFTSPHTTYLRRHHSLARGPRRRTPKFSTLIMQASVVAGPLSTLPSPQMWPDLKRHATEA